MLRDSGLYIGLQQHSYDQNGNLMCIYGDLAYPLRPQLQSPFRNVRPTVVQTAYNRAMSKVRIGVEWVFGDIVNFFKFLDFKKNLKLGLQPIGKNVHCLHFFNELANLYVWSNDIKLFQY